MSDQKELTQQRLTAWTDRLAQLELPEWDRLPQLDLYMDQVIILLTQYLEPLSREAEKSITASIINNYVRMKIMPPPVKKKYSRVHLAYLMIICILKQSLSISCIKKMLPEEPSEAAVRQLYDEFVRQFRSSCAAFASHVQSTGELVLPLSGGNLVMAAAIFSNLSKDLTEYLLQEESDGPNP